MCLLATTNSKIRVSVPRVVRLCQEKWSSFSSGSYAINLENCSNVNSEWINKCCSCAFCTIISMRKSSGPDSSKTTENDSRWSNWSDSRSCWNLSLQNRKSPWRYGFSDNFFTFSNRANGNELIVYRDVSTPSDNDSRFDNNSLKDFKYATSSKMGNSIRCNCGFSRIKPDKSIPSESRGFGLFF